MANNAPAAYLCVAVKNNFLSPAMPLDAVPESLRRSCKFAMVVGEFAARYEDVYGHLNASDRGVLVTEGAEAYLPGWVGLVLSL